MVSVDHAEHAFLQCIACVGESFEEPDVVGVALSIRSKEDVLSIWLRDSSNQIARIKVGYVLLSLILDSGQHSR